MMWPHNMAMLWPETQTHTQLVHSAFHLLLLNIAGNYFITAHDIFMSCIPIALSVVTLHLGLR